MRRAPGFDAASRYLDELVHQGSLQGLERSDEDVAAKCGLLTLVKQHNWQDKANFLLILCRGPRLPRQVDQHVAEFLLPRGLHLQARAAAVLYGLDPARWARGVSSDTLSDSIRVLSFEDVCSLPQAGAPPKQWYGVRQTDRNGRVLSLLLQQHILPSRLLQSAVQTKGFSSLTRLTLSRSLLVGATTEDLLPCLAHCLPSIESLGLEDCLISGRLDVIGDLIGPGTEHSLSTHKCGSFQHLKNLNLAHNNITGEIPPELGRFVQLELVFLLGNRLSGGFPSEVGLLTSVKTFDVCLNPELRGPIPDECRWMVEKCRLFTSKGTGLYLR